jgi:hypothetical protein
MNTEDKQTPAVEEEELIPVETPPEADQDDDEQDDDDQDDGDERLADDEDTDEEVAKQTNRERRKKRRELQKLAKQRAERELAELRQHNQLLEQRLRAVEGYNQNSAAQSLEARLAQTQRDIQQAEMIIAKAVEAGNGEDVAAAIRIRDAANAQLQQLAGYKQQMAQRQQQANQPQTPQIDPQVVNYAQQWLSANPWYDPNASDRDSALTKAIDNEIAKEGYDPRTREYWEELTSRVADALGEGGDQPKAQGKRKGPPTGGARSSPVSSRKEIYVTPERKAAMVEAGIWDDPVRRQKMLREYQAYDQQTAR